jgi:sugar-specific transcriptional regulator TrmB
MSNGFDFSDIGLSTRDKRVYEALLAGPGASLRKLADATGINRGSVYESIKELMAVGLVGSVQTGQRQQFIAQEPSLIIELLEERRQAAQAAQRSAERYITELAKLNPKQEETPSFAIYYEGDEGAAAILRDVLRTMRARPDKQYYVISSKRIRRYIYTNFTNYTQQRIKYGIRVSVLAVGEGGQDDELANRLWLPEGDHPTNCYTIIYGSKTAFISLDETNVLSGIVIDNEGVTNLQKLQFQTIWQNLAQSKNS